MTRARTHSPFRNGFPALLVLVLAVALLGLAPGCIGKNTNGNAARYLGGNYNSNNEPPAFGDPEIAAMTADATYNDPFNHASAAADAPGAVTRLRVVWGNLIVDPDATAIHDYSGQMTIDDGTLVVERLIAFDAYDSQVDTRDDPTKIAWISHTRPAFDGLAVRVEPGTTPAATNTLHVQIGSFTKEITVAQLADLTFCEPTGLGNDHVAFASRAGTDADTGFLYGHWRDVAHKGGGVFKGKWESASGTLGGHELGRYVYDGRLIRGKAIDTDGNFVALLAGTFERTDPTERIGAFQLDWLNADASPRRTSHGVYLHVPGRALGFGLGTWKND